MGAFATAANNALMRVLLEADPSGVSDDFDIIRFLDNTANYLKKIGHYIMILAGVILVIVAVVQIAKGLAGGGRGQVNWVMSIACLLVGGMLIFGGWNLATKVAKIGKGTIEKLGGGSGIEGDVGEGGGADDSNANFAAVGN